MYERFPQFAEPLFWLGGLLILSVGVWLSLHGARIRLSARRGRR